MTSCIRAFTILCLILPAAGCHFKTPDGKALNVREYDAIIVEQVVLAPEIVETPTASLLKGYTAISALKSKHWRIAEPFDIEAFAGEVETFSIAMDGDDSKPDEPEVTREDFLKKHEKAVEALRNSPDGGKPLRPVHLRMFVTELRFPKDFEAVTIGTKPRMRCRVDVYADGKLLGSGEMEAIAGLPGIPLMPAAMAGRVAEVVFFDSYTKKTILKLVEEMGDETIGALSRAK